MTELERLAVRWMELDAELSQFLEDNPNPWQGHMEHILDGTPLPEIAKQYNALSRSIAQAVYEFDAEYKKHFPIPVWRGTKSNRVQDRTHRWNIIHDAVKKHNPTLYKKMEARRYVNQ